MLRASVSEHSQSHVLKYRMERAGLTHGQEVRVNLRGVQVVPKTETEGVIYFCNMEDIEVVEVLSDGDGMSLPTHATVKNLAFPRRGVHDLNGVILNSNGSLQVIADEHTNVSRHRPWLLSAFKRLVGIDVAG